ncbi:hypothetical protein AN936_20015 [Sphingopyxis macrogoltabida]|uniref:Uncharacterized protein n=1 Tax=Sphingopyxis macrogoltabida TaxID=33050 RepID=A0A0N9V3X7_SPHMC|nr:hypothetical protein AN936_20015 [Sphingopyxis macrogoltabida]
MLFQSPCGKAEEVSGFLGAQVAWRQGGEIRSHEVASVVVQDAADDQRHDMRTVAKTLRYGG